MTDWSSRQRRMKEDEWPKPSSMLGDMNESLEAELSKDGLSVTWAVSPEETANSGAQPEINVNVVPADRNSGYSVLTRAVKQILGLEKMSTDMVRDALSALGQSTSKSNSWCWNRGAKPLKKGQTERHFTLKL